MSESTTTVCKWEIMQGFVQNLGEVDSLLADACKEAGELKGKFEDAYEGEAREEVILFLENLPPHLERLQLLYRKLGQFILMTSASFSHNDTGMAEKLGKGTGDGN